MDRALTPRELGVGRCAALPPIGYGGKPAGCPGTVVRVGVIRRRQPGRQLEAWLMFACAVHADELPLIGTRSLLDRDREVLERWRAERARWDLPPGHPDRPGPHGRPWIPPEPLAVGPAAAELLDRAARL